MRVPKGFRMPAANLSHCCPSRRRFPAGAVSAARIRGPPAVRSTRLFRSISPAAKARTMRPFFENAQTRLFHAEQTDVLPRLEPASYDAVITDPPYCSGGLTAGQRRQDPTVKYAHKGDAKGRPSFGGDLKDQRSFTWWCMSWLIECRKALKPGGYCLVFIDWRQLPALTDAFQAADLTWRGVIAWDKGGGSRAPHKGYFRHQCEYLVWGTKGACPQATHAGPFPGCYSIPVRKADKFHLTGKPTELLRELVQVVPPGSRILDPFAGSGTTLVAAQELGRIADGIEREAEYCEITRGRLQPVQPAEGTRRSSLTSRSLAI